MAYLAEAAAGSAGTFYTVGLLFCHLAAGYLLMMLFLSFREHNPTLGTTGKRVFWGVSSMLFLSMVVLPRPLFHLSVHRALGDLDRVAREIQSGHAKQRVVVGNLVLINLSSTQIVTFADADRARTRNNATALRIELVRLGLPDGSLLWKPVGGGTDYGDKPFEGQWHWKPAPAGTPGSTEMD